MTRLPGLIGLIEDVTGFESAIALAEHLGGESIYIPARIGPDHPFMAIMTVAEAQALANRFRGEKLYIPKAHPHLARLYRSQGMSVADIASRLGITTRGVRHHLD